MKSILFISIDQFGYFTMHYNYSYYLKDKYKINYLCFDHGYAKKNLDGVEVHYIIPPKNKIKRKLVFYKKAISLIYSNNYNIVIVKYFKACLFVKIFFPFRKIYMDIPTGYLSQNNFIRNLANASIFLESMFFNKSLILSESLRQRLKIPSWRSHIIPLGACPKEIESKEFIHLGMLYVGTISYRRITDTIKGLKLYLSRYKGDQIITYDIIGFGTKDEENELRRTIDENELSGSVIFHGRKFGEELDPFLDHCNIGIAYVPVIKGYDVQPVTKLFEYMLSGMPVIATSTSENRKVINEINGILIDDNPESFCSGLKSLIGRLPSYNSVLIRESVKEYNLHHIVNTKLLPIL